MLMAMEYFGDQFDAIGVRNQVTVLDEASLAAALSVAGASCRPSTTRAAGSARTPSSRA
jgi:hypothetical protein